MSLWHYALDGKPAGPSPLTELEQLVRGGRVLTEAPVWTEGMEAWIPLSEAIPEVAALAPAASTASVPPPFPTSPPEFPASPPAFPESPRKPVSEAPPSSATSPSQAATPRKKSRLWLWVRAIFLLFLMIVVLIVVVTVVIQPRQLMAAAAKSVPAVSAEAGVPAQYFPTKAGSARLTRLFPENNVMTCWYQSHADIVFNKPVWNLKIRTFNSQNEAELWSLGQGNLNVLEPPTLVESSPQGNSFNVDLGYGSYNAIRWSKDQYGFEVYNFEPSATIKDFAADYRRAAGL